MKDPGREENAEDGQPTYPICFLTMDKETKPSHLVLKFNGPYLFSHIQTNVNEP